MHQFIAFTKVSHSICCFDQPACSSVAVAHEEKAKDEQVQSKFNIRLSWNLHFHADTNNLTNVI
jgi:hypothetical protein